MANIKYINGNPIVATAVELADGSLSGAVLTDGSVGGAKIADGSIVSGKIADGAVTNGKIADGSVTTAKIADGAVTLEKLGNDIELVPPDGSVTDAKLAPRGTNNVLDTAEYAKTNLLSATERTDNVNDSPIGRWYFNTSNGRIAPDTWGTHVGMSALVAVKPSTQYRIKAFDIGGTLYWAFYDSNRAFISHASGSSGQKDKTVETPETCAYINVFLYASAGLTLSDTARILITENLLRSDYITPLSAVDLTARDGVSDTAKVLEEGTEATRNINTSTVGRWYIRATGAIEASSTNYFGMAEMVAAQPSTTYTVTIYNVTFSGTGQLHVAEYDENGTFIQKATYDIKRFATFTSLAETHYVCVHVYRSGGVTIADDSQIQIEVGSMSTSYVPPYTFVDYVAREGAEDGIPSYLIQNVQDAVTKVNADLLPVGKHGDAFVFVTDVHWRNNTQHSPALVKYVLDNTNVRMVINGGDNLQGHLTTKAGAANEIMAGVNAFIFDGVRCLGVMGNHDNNTNNNSGAPESHLSQDEQFTLINRAYGTDGLHYGDGNYYYYDNTVAKVRYMMLDWGANATAQTAWVASVMGALPDEYKVVVVVHGIYRTTSGDETHELIMERRYIVDAFEPYKSDVLFFLQGHTHWDGVVNAYDSGTPIIITTCDTFSEAAGSVRNTLTEQCIDVVVFDYDAGTVKCTRIGRGEHRTVTL